ncbi:hypothetical protein [Campylobacter vulpis]|uniref:hypothetical protein n=1 Tax=Campylobacter vulpis TaxID=1655500 RepID=UPI001BD03D93|nr:hypothetical protein [Campylobacter vulpis]MBS4235560.1 hypothetical protein [Campylobacter vulpis]MBS4269518.1 hypothetical protein [Campylobacter vulpis]
MNDLFQRIFLLHSFDLNTEKMPQSVSITTFYTKISPKETLKFQSIDEKYFLLKNGLREEISKKEFKKAKEKALLEVLSKKSYEFLDGDRKFLFQIYKEKKLFILKILFKNEEDARQFKLDEKIRPLRELDEKFNSKNLILYKYKNAFFDLHTCFNIIEKNQNFTLNFPQSLYANDGFRVLLFYLLYAFKSQAKKENGRVKLHFCVLKICVFLRNAIELFDDKMAQKLLAGFEKLEEKLKQNVNTKKRFNIRLYKNLLNDFELFLREGEFYKSAKKDVFLKVFVAQKLRLKLILFKKFFIRNFSYDEFMFQCLELRIFLEHFADFFNDKNLEKLKAVFDEDIFIKFIKKQMKILKLIEKTSKNLKIYKG